MPELPEVETYRRYFEETCLYQPIADLFVEDKKLLTTELDVLLSRLRGRSFVGTRRVGKNLFVQTDGDFWVHFHFGMTGDLAYFRDAEDTPRFARIIFYFQNRFRLAFLCPRKFERLGIVDDVDAYLKKKKIARDALDVTLEELSATVSKKKAFIKPVLLDQGVVAGIGNWIVDEVLFQAKIHPERRADTLNADELTRLHESIQAVLTTAIRHEANYELFPKTFLIHAREWAPSPFDDPLAHRLCPDGKPVQVITVGGRTTYFCPDCQKKFPL